MNSDFDTQSDSHTLVDSSRRDFLKRTLIASSAAMFGGVAPMFIQNAYAADFGEPEKTDLTIGFIPLTDCASVVMAGELGLYKKYGLNVTISKEASWAAVRDKLLLGQLDAAHVLYGLIYGAHLGIGSQKKDMAILMNINYNGQAITLSKKLAEAGIKDGASLKKAVDKKDREYTFAQTFPTGTHAMWLYYWLAANGIDPFRDVKNIVIPPPQMVANMRVGNMDGFCVGEPWNARAIFDKVGFTATTTQAIWKNHPEKVLGTTKEFVDKYPNTTRAMMAAVLEASQYIDTMSNRDKVSETIGGKSYVNAPSPVILGRMQGKYEDGLGKKWDDPDYMKFHMDGEVNFPYVSHGAWFLTQHRRWGLLKADVDYLGIASAVNQTGVYTEVAKALNIAVPSSPLKTETLFDGTVFDPTKAVEYANGFKIKA